MSPNATCVPLELKVLLKYWHSLFREKKSSQPLGTNLWGGALWYLPDMLVAYPASCRAVIQVAFSMGCPVKFPHQSPKAC